MKVILFWATIGSLLAAALAWEVGLVSPSTGPYWYAPIMASVIFAILYAGTKGGDNA